MSFGSSRPRRHRHYPDGCLVALIALALIASNVALSGAHRLRSQIRTHGQTTLGTVDQAQLSDRLQLKHQMMARLRMALHNAASDSQQDTQSSHHRLQWMTRLRTALRGGATASPSGSPAAGSAPSLVTNDVDGEVVSLLELGTSSRAVAQQKPGVDQGDRLTASH
jgi:hypothetical protein